MNIKKLTCLLMILILTLSFAACGKGGTGDGKNETDANETTGETIPVKPYDYDLSEYIKPGNYPAVEYSASALNTIVENTVKSLCERNAVKIEITDRTAKEGDIANIDFVGKIDGVAFDNGSGTEYDLELGSHSFIDGFEDGVVGHSVGEEFDIDLNFPDPYEKSPDLAGKAVVFTVKLNKITEKQIPELTDELAVKEGFESKDALIEYATCQCKEKVVWQSYLTSCELIKTPDSEVDTMKNNVDDYYKSVAESYNIDFDTFVTYMGFSDVDSYNTLLEQQVKAAVKEEMLIYQTERINNITYTDEEYASLGLEVAKSMGYNTLDELEESSTENDIRREIIRKKIINILIENAIEID